MRRKARKLTASLLSSSSDFWHRIHAKAAGEIRLKTSVAYNRISWETPKRAQDFLRSSLSHYRRNHIDAALSELEAGLDVYPDAGRLLATHLRICCEHDRLVRVTDFINPTKRQLCKTLASLHVVDSGPDLQSIDECQDHGPVCLTQGIINKNFDDDVLKHWRLADLMEHAGKVDIASKIYRRLVRRPTCQPDDYLYGGVSDIRLGNVNGGFKTLASGLATYPESESLQSVFRDSCYGQLTFEHYLQLNTIRGKEEVEPSRLALDFYRHAFKLNPPEAFIVKFRDARFNCDHDDFIVLQNEFLAQLRDSGEDIDRVKLWILLSKLLGLDDDFCQRVYLVLHSRDWRGGDKISKHLLTLIYKLTLPLVPNYEFDAEEVMRQFTLDAEEFSGQPLELSEPIADFGKHWAVWTSMFCLVQPKLYRHAISAFEKVAFKLWPRLDYTAPHIHVPLSLQGTAKRKIRIGFTVLDLMPMMSGLVERLDKDIFETVFLRAGRSGGSQTANDWIARAGATVEYSDTNAYSAIETIADQKLDILISGPCVPQIFFPLMARLAHLHMVLLEPNWPDGIKNSDYYISWRLAEPENYKEFYKTPVSLLRTPPYWIEKPSASEGLAISARTGDDIRHGLLGLGPNDRFYICANTPTKIHTQMDEILYKLLERDPAGYLVFLRGEHSPAHLLRARLREKMGRSYERVIFLNTLEKNDAHSLLMSADCCIDSYPICGMSSSFDGIRLGVPIVTLPADIPFGRWTAAIYEYLGVSDLTATDVDDYIRIATRLAMDKAWRLEKSAELREKSSLYVESKASFDEFQHFIVQAWRRKQAGLPPTSWVAGEWQ